MLDAHRLRRILPHRFDQIHLLLDQVAVSDQLLHLPFFRNQLFPLRVLQLLLCPDQFLVDLISLTRIWRIAGAPYTDELGRAHIGDHARPAKHFREGADLAFRFLQHPSDLVGAA